jgi:hypothetical protein
MTETSWRENCACELDKWSREIRSSKALLLLNPDYAQNPLLGLAGVKECKRLLTTVDVPVFPRRSATDHLHQIFGVPSPLHRDL